MPPNNTDSNRNDEQSAEITSETDRTVREERSFSRMRQTIASRLQDSYQNAVHVTVSRDVDAEELTRATEIAKTQLDMDIWPW